MITVLLIMFVLNGEAHTLAVQAAGPDECEIMKLKTPDVLPKLIGKNPQFFAAACATVQPFLTDT